MEYTPGAAINAASSLVQPSKMKYVPFAALEHTAYAPVASATTEEVKARYMTVLGSIQSIEWAANFLGELTPKEILNIVSDLVERLEKEHGYPAAVAFGGTLSGWKALALLQEGSKEVSWVALSAGLGIKSEAPGVISSPKARFNSYKLNLGLAAARLV